MERLRLLNYGTPLHSLRAADPFSAYGSSRIHPLLRGKYIISGFRLQQLLKKEFKVGKGEWVELK